MPHGTSTRRPASSGSVENRTTAPATTWSGKRGSSSYELAPSRGRKRGMEQLLTESLQLDPLTRDDYPWLCALYADPEVMRYIGSGVRTVEQSLASLDFLLVQATR